MSVENMLADVRRTRGREKAEIADGWRQHAAKFEAKARQVREDGDPAFAEEYERVAGDYRLAADELAYELEGVRGCVWGAARVLEGRGVKPPTLIELERLYQRRLDVMRPDGRRDERLADLWLDDHQHGAVQPTLPGLT